jgi:metallo-beta-lactamase family protein
MRWLSGFNTPPRTTFIVHGEPDSAEALRVRLTSELGWNAVIPAHNQIVELN